MRAADCGVYPARAEGWNLELLETMAVGRPVITTFYSAHTEFCNDENSHLIKIRSLEDAIDGKPFFQGQGKWAHLDNESIDEIARAMHEVYSNRISWNEAGVETGQKFTWKNTAKRLVEVLNGDNSQTYPTYGC